MPVIDCTLRDGGYYNNWDFDQPFVDGYLQTMNKSGVDYVEIGFRGAKGGTYANVTDGMIESMNLRRPKFAVMINAKTALAHELGADSYVLGLFQPRVPRGLSLVRIAAHLNEAISCRPVCAALKALGYEVALNLMQCADKPMASIDTACKVIDSWGLVDVLYIADSLGSLSPISTMTLVDQIRVGGYWTQPVGVHMHDNCGMAFANTVSAIEGGATWVDSTVSGMGRGSGNAKTEHVLTALGIPYNGDPVFDFSSKVMNVFRDMYGWGTNQFYFLSARYGVHPTYVQDMIAGQVPHKAMMNILRKLRDSKACIHDAKLLHALLSKEKL